MEFKNDWERAKERFCAFWQGELVDRCCFAVTAWKDGKAVEYPFPKEAEACRRHWMDEEYIIQRNENIMRASYYGGESFPAIFVNLGAAGHAGFFKGAKYRFTDSYWSTPSLEDLDALEFDEQSELYQKTLSLAEAFVQAAKGRYFVSMPDSTGNADALAHLYGSGNLLMDMIEEPQAVERALRKIEAVYEKTMLAVFERVRANNEGGGVVQWLSTWAPGLHAQMQCDLSCMISPQMFERFILPELEAQCALLEYPLYHLDGMEQIRHLDALLSIPRLKAIQWTQVAGQRPATAYLPELRRIQAAGKNLVILVEPEQIRPLMEGLSSKGLFLVARADDQEQAERMLRDVERYTHE